MNEATLGSAEYCIRKQQKSVVFHLKFPVQFTIIHLSFSRKCDILTLVNGRNSMTENLASDIRSGLFSG
jgi:hypothetical protein